MGPEEHGGHCELEFDGLEVPVENVLMNEGDGLRVTQIRLGPARLTHCMRWLGFAKRCMEIAQEYVGRREGFGIKLADRESVQIKLGEVAHQIQIGRLLTMHAAWKLDQGDRARKEVSMAKVQVADTLHQAADVAIQLQGARGYSKDTIVEWIYRYGALGAPRRRRLRSAQDGARPLHARRGPRLLEVGVGRSLSAVIAGLDPAIYEAVRQRRLLRKMFNGGASSWMPGSSPGMTPDSHPSPPRSPAGSRRRSRARSR